MTEKKQRLLTFEELAEHGVPLSRSTVFRLERDGKFPKRVVLGRRNHIRWIADEVEKWVSDRIAAR